MASVKAEMDGDEDAGGFVKPSTPPETPIPAEESSSDRKNDTALTERQEGKLVAYLDGALLEMNRKLHAR